MRTALILLLSFLGGCTTTAAGLAETGVKEVIESRKAPKDFATCAAEHLAANAQLRSDGEHYWIIQTAMEIPRIRWDFLPTPTGSRAEKRSTTLGNFSDGGVRACA